MGTIPKKREWTQMCIVRIGFDYYLMQASRGADVVKLLQGAVEVDYWVGRKAIETFVTGNPLRPIRVEYRTLERGQIVAKREGVADA